MSSGTSGSNGTVEPKPPAEWRTYLLTQRNRSAGRESTAIAEAAIEAGIDAIQLREKGVDARQRYRLGRRLRDRTAGTDVAFIVNDRIDLAAAVDADGVHLGQSDLPVGVARERLGPSAIVGCSASTVAEATAAAEAGADYLGVGAVYGSDSKAVADRKDGIGPERVREIAAAVPIPVVGIGGIDADNAAPVVAAGAAGVAVISAITAAEDPGAATRDLREAVADAR
ncbi:thiamine phosphate synthase [Halopenitus persicus]|uniref:Thiamine-phosphate synthase n=1 Tax=Halopenitus persicus TaxID=1048396 RepID=A0A1H3ES53_9EURY|nr:thiamine phosphate synthase [Halopenitus persicus]SDX81563.1 thiamine-phosphate diphosphorylase [Halopenitus persicus]